MPTVGDFRPVFPGGKQLEAGESAIFPFTLPDNVFNKAIQPQGYVTFDYYLSNAQNLIFELRLNGQDIDSYSGLNGTLLNHNMELINSTCFKSGENEFEIIVEKGSGVLHIYETVIHYHLEI
jgi:hypothetical protein